MSGDETDNKTPVLMYHEVLDVVERERSVRAMVPLYCLSAHQFRQQMDYLRRHEYGTVTMEDLGAADREEPSTMVGITFDDGLVGNYRFAFPILGEFGFNATVFLVVSRIGNDPRFLDWGQVAEMSAAGILIGSHTMTHRPLETIASDEVFNELHESKSIIEDRIGRPVKHLSLPHGSANDRVLETAREVGYSTICTSDIGTAIRGVNPSVIERIPIVDKDDLRRFARIVELDSRVIRKLARVKRLKSRVKRMIGIETYRKLYRLLFRIRPGHTHGVSRRS
jgi:peptidoglycan/xylan/chitin deacetylase (PgdA/CDA1 family)